MLGLFVWGLVVDELRILLMWPFLMGGIWNFLYSDRPLPTDTIYKINLVLICEHCYFIMEFQNPS